MTILRRTSTIRPFYLIRRSLFSLDHPYFHNFGCTITSHDLLPPVHDRFSACKRLYAAHQSPSNSVWLFGWPYWPLRLLKCCVTVAARLANFKWIVPCFAAAQRILYLIERCEIVLVYVLANQNQAGPTQTG